MVILAGKSPYIYGHIRCIFTVLANPTNITLYLPAKPVVAALQTFGRAALQARVPSHVVN